MAGNIEGGKVLLCMCDYSFQCELECNCVVEYYFIQVALDSPLSFSLMSWFYCVGG